MDYLKLKILIILFLLPSLSYGATLDIKLIKPMNGHEYSVSLSDSIEAVRLKADYSYSEVEDIIIKDRGSLEIYYDSPINDKWKIWFFNLAQYNNVYETRENYLGAGPKYYIFNGEHKLSLSTGVLYGYDHVTGEGHGRYSHRPKYAYKDIVDAVYYYQPDINDSDNYIKKYEVSSIVPYTEGVGKVYCLKEYRSLIGTIDKECGFLATIKIKGGD
ncbi:hypothetical protein KAR91_64480 [Candidatus Pacearchaeota archaeon]|nr:hypothetical protein [Candidatus Pacearchaeota archaeon]